MTWLVKTDVPCLASSVSGADFSSYLLQWSTLSRQWSTSKRFKINGDKLCIHVATRITRTQLDLVATLSETHTRARAHAYIDRATDKLFEILAKTLFFL